MDGTLKGTTTLGVDLEDVVALLGLRYKDTREELS